MTTNKRSISLWMLFGVFAGALSGGAMLAGYYYFKSDKQQRNQCVISQELTAQLAQAKGTIAALQPVTPGIWLGDISFQDSNAKSYRLADWQGRTVLVNLWASWCFPCREEMPSLDALDKKLESSNFDVVAISIDNDTLGNAQEFYRQNQINHLAFYIDSSINSFYKIKQNGLGVGLPTTVIIDKNGCAIAKMSGSADWASNQAVSFLSKLIKINHP